MKIFRKKNILYMSEVEGSQKIPLSEAVTLFKHRVVECEDPTLCGVLRDFVDAESVCNHIVCADKIPSNPGKLFFGDSGKFLHLVKVSHEVFSDLRDIGFAGFWTWRKFDFARDKKNWEFLPDNAKRMFLLNNAYQSLMDSGVVTEYDYLTMLATNTELSLLYKYISQNESIHGPSYSYGLLKMFESQAEEKVNIVYTDPVVKARMESEISFSDELREVAFLNKETDYSKMVILKNIVATYLLESIKFPFSFFVTWRINEAYNDALQAFSMLLLEISHDELIVHAPTNSNVLKILKRDSSQGFQHLTDSLTKFTREYARYVAEQEIQWNKYLHNEGSIPGFTEEIGEEFIKYMTNRALRRAGFEPIFDTKKSDFITWFDEYRNSNMRNIAQQEQQNTNYQKGVLKNDILASLDKLREMAEAPTLVKPKKSIDTEKSEIGHLL